MRCHIDFSDEHETMVIEDHIIVGLVTSVFLDHSGLIILGDNTIFLISEAVLAFARSVIFGIFGIFGFFGIFDILFKGNVDFLICESDTVDVE